LRHSSLFRKVLFGLIGVFVMLAVAISIGSAWQVNRSLTAEFLSKGTAIGNSIATSAVDLMLNRDPSTLQSTIDQFLTIRGVGYVFVVDEQGEIVTHTFVPGIPGPIHQLAQVRRSRSETPITTNEVEIPGAGSYVDISAPILAGVAGTAHVGMDRATIAGDVRSAILQQQATLVAVLFPSMLLAYVFVRRTARPLQALTAYVGGIANNGFQRLEPDPRVERMAEQSRDEIGDLTRAFLSMSSTLSGYVGDLKRAKDELAEYSQSLEQRVARRTEELVEKNRAVERTLNQLKQAQEQIVAQEKLASLGALTAGIAHEIKNPLNFVNNFADLSGELMTELQETLAKTLPAGAAADVDDVLGLLRTNVTKIAEHGRRADSIVRNMLQHSRGRKGERTRVDLNALVHEYVGLAYHGMRGMDQSFNARLEEHYDPTVGTISAVPQDLGRALLNLLTNACYAIHEKQRQSDDGFGPALTLATHRLGDRVEVRIRDNGNGLPPEVRERMFEPFFTTKPAGSGTGLGLSIAFEIIVQTHQGAIRVETEPGQFAEFIITLPGEVEAAPAASA
jgi:signal transduction histidine kinase